MDNAYRRKATIVAMMGSFLIVFHLTMINVAFPQIQAAFGADVQTIRWVFNAMFLSTAVLMPVVGWLGRAIGLKNVYILGFLIYTITTLLSGSAWNINVLIIYQVIQGIGAGLLMPATVALISGVYPPEERGRGMVYWSIANSMGGTIGPLLGGFVADNISWRLIYYINTPLAFSSLIICLLFLNKDEDKVREKFDYLGFLFLAIAIVCLLVALSQGRIEGWKSNFILSLLLIFVVSFAAWIVTELKVKKPLIDLAMMRDKFFVAGMAMTFLIGISLYGTNFLMPLFMQTILAYSVFRSAVVIVIGVFISVFVSRLAGPLADKYTPRFPLVIGVVFWVLFSFMFSQQDGRASFYVLGLIMVLRGVGYGLTLPPMMSGSLTTLPPRFLTMASSMVNLTFTLGGMFGIALLGTLLDQRELTYYANYASEQNLSSPGTVNAISMLQSFFISLGHVSANAKGMAMTVLSGMVRKEAIISAFQDSFIFLTLATLIALVPALAMGRVKRQQPISRG